MAGNSIGELFRLTTFGESHGPAIGGILDGCPPGLVLDLAAIQHDLDRRKPGSSRFTTARREDDVVKILSGVFEGVTTGTSIGLLIENTDQRSQDYSAIKDVFRPGHADYTYWHKYGIRDYRGGGRSSARETAVRVAAGAIAKQYLQQRFGVQIRACLTQLGPIQAAGLDSRAFDWDFVEQNDFFCPDPAAAAQMDAFMRDLKKQAIRLAHAFTSKRQRCLSVGEPVFDRLDADIAHAMMSINAVKAVEIGDGFAVVSQQGSTHRDALTPDGFTANHAGGILGGISSGQTIRVSIALKPTSSITIAGASINTAGESVQMLTKGRHDPCVGIRAVPIAEAMLAMVLMDHAMRHQAQNGHVSVQTPDIAARARALGHAE